MLAEAWDYHPFGPVFLLAFAGIALVSVLPPVTQGRLAAWIARHPHPSLTIYVALVAGFEGFGAVRALLHVAHWAAVVACCPG